jgi:hypothetical protein
MSEQKANIGLFKVVASVFAAMFGVQSGKNRERDFQHGRPAAYIIVGIIMTVLFVLTVWMVVKLVLGAAGV